MTTGPKLKVSPLGGIKAAIGLLILIPVLVPLFAAALIWISEHDADRAARDRVTAAARVVSADVHAMIQGAIDRLHRLDDSLGPDPAAFKPRPAAGGEAGTALYDAEGYAIARDGARGAQNVASNAEFKAVAAGKPWAITPLIRAGQIRIFGVVRRLERNGKFAGAAAVYFAGDALSDIWTEAALGPDSTLGLFRDDGWLITRYPVPPEAVNLAGYELFTEHLKKSPDGVYTPPASPIDGVPRTVGYASLKDLGLVVTASVSRVATTEAFWSRVGSTALVAAPVFIAMVLLCGWAVLLLLRHERSRVQLEVALAQNRILLQEIHHRVKNNLQQVAAMVRLQQAPAAMKEDLTRRIAAMSAVHQHIYESGQFGALDAEAYLARVLSGLRDTAPPGVVLDWRLAPLQLSPDQALPLGLIVNEVVSNAFKHGFPDGRAGKVSVTLERPLDGDEAILAIADTGVGMGETPAGGQGLGTRLIAALVAQLGGKSTLTRDTGVRFEMRFPVSG